MLKNELKFGTIKFMFVPLFNRRVTSQPKLLSMFFEGEIAHVLL